MKPGTTLLLVVLGAAALGAGWYYGVGRLPAPETSAPAERLVFPGLAAKLQTAARIEIVHGGQTITFDHVGEHWGLAGNDDYPVQPSKLRELLTGLTELRFAEQRTADPAEFSRLGVEDPKQANADSNLVRVLDAAGQPIAELIIGRSKPRAEGNVPDSVYIRRPNETQSWLAEGKLPLAETAKDWLDKFVADIPARQIAAMTSTRGADTLAIGRKGEALEVTAPAQHPPLEASKVNDVGTALERVTFVDVKRDARPESGDKPAGAVTASSVFTTTDGMKVSGTLLKLGSETWIRLAATGDGAGAAPAKALNARLDGWLYQLGSWKEQNLFPTLDGLKAPPPAAPPAAGGAAQGLPPGFPAMPGAAGGLPAGHPQLPPPASTAP